jgi:hypothetical protein
MYSINRKRITQLVARLRQHLSGFFPTSTFPRGADVPLAGQTVPAINVFGPNRGTQNTLAAVVGNVNTRSIVLTIHFARHTVK